MKLPTRTIRSSKAGVDADSKLVQVDISWRQTDRKNRVGEGDWSGQLQQRNVSNVYVGVVLGVRNDSGHACIHHVRVRIILVYSSQSYLQLWWWRISFIKHNTAQYLSTHPSANRDEHDINKTMPRVLAILSYVVLFSFLPDCCYCLMALTIWLAQFVLHIVSI